MMTIPKTNLTLCLICNRNLTFIILKITQANIKLVNNIGTMSYFLNLLEMSETLDVKSVFGANVNIPKKKPITYAFLLK